MPRTTQAFFDFLRHQATHTKQLYLLGDIFEAWAGDDDIDDPFNQQVINELKKVRASGVEIFWIAGNRDFLVGQQSVSYTHLTLPTICSV